MLHHPNILETNVVISSPLLCPSLAGPFPPRVRAPSEPGDRRGPTPSPQARARLAAGAPRLSPPGARSAHPRCPSLGGQTPRCRPGPGPCLASAVLAGGTLPRPERRGAPLLPRPGEQRDATPQEDGTRGAEPGRGGRARGRHPPSPHGRARRERTPEAAELPGRRTRDSVLLGRRHRAGAGVPRPRGDTRPPRQRPAEALTADGSRSAGPAGAPGYLEAELRFPGFLLSGATVSLTGDVG